MSNRFQGPEQLENSWRVFKVQWQIASSQWDDAARQRFEREFIDGYEEIIYATLKQMDDLAQVLVQASKQLR